MNPSSPDPSAAVTAPPDLLWYTVRSIALVGAFGTFMYLLGKRSKAR